MDAPPNPMTSEQPRSQPGLDVDLSRPKSLWQLRDRARGLRNRRFGTRYDSAPCAASFVSSTSRTSAAPAARELALKQARLLRHRGPDWSGMWAGDQAVMAHERLAIVDVLHGAQPLRSIDGTASSWPSTARSTTTTRLRAEIGRRRRVPDRFRLRGHPAAVRARRAAPARAGCAGCSPSRCTTRRRTTG